MSTRNIDSPFEVLTVMDYFERLTEKEQYVVGWRTGMYGPPKTNKALAKELSLSVDEIDSLYTKSITYLKTNLIE